MVIEAEMFKSIKNGIPVYSIKGFRHVKLDSHKTTLLCTSSNGVEDHMSYNDIIRD